MYSLLFNKGGDIGGNIGGIDFNRDNLKFYGIVVIVLIFVIWYYNLIYQSRVIHKLVNGFWEADASFCIESEIDMFCIYFDEDVDFFGNRACYVLVKKDDMIIINEPTVVNLSLQWQSMNNWSSDISLPKYLNVRFEHIDEECAEIFPKAQEMCFYPICNKIVLSAGDTITAAVYKNSMNTELKSLLNKMDKNQSQTEHFDDDGDEDGGDD
jgi:hypothetical protein